ncbi:MAG TPA: dihydrolipoamide acetyltransferase family protein [Solirubrobacteraceae bacterium]|nr:dihydrolipoamide acetyltransferase family protein [Solirubrobacteraceae bacterium]
MTEISMPRLSDSMEEGTILSWLREDGEHVAVGDELVEIETDKATMTYESPAEGVLRVLARVGETLAVGAPIAQLGAVDEPLASDLERVSHAQGGKPAPSSTVHVSTDGNGNAGATPLARRMATVHGVDLDRLEGTGPRGRITRADVAASAGIEDPVDTGRVPPGRDPEIRPAFRDTSRTDAPPTQDLTRVQQLIARRMSEAKATIPEFQVQTEADIDALLALRAQLKDQPGPPDPLPSLNDFIVKACALALRRHPRANGSYRDGRFELHEHVNVGIAVAATDALIVATIADADTRSVGAIACEAHRLAAAVRDGSVAPPDLAGATFTVSNLGMYGMTAITPVINPPQAAILGVGAARATPALRDGELVERRLMTLTLSCDHRILYGADAAEFLSDIRRRLESPLTLLL